MKKLITTLALTSVSFGSLAAQQCLESMNRTVPTTQYQLHDNGTVTDQVTGLTWMRCPVGMTWEKEQAKCTGSAQKHSWQSALLTTQAINDVNGNHSLHQFAGVEKWRMPNIKELVSLIERACHSPALNGTVFGDAYTVEQGDLAGYIWSNTPNGDGQNVLSLETVNGEVYNYSIDTDLSVLLVADQ